MVKVPDSIEHIRARMHTILIRSADDDEKEVDTVLRNIENRADGATRIV